MAMARREADGLAHAARQMGPSDWEAALSAFAMGADAGSEAIAQLVLRLEELGESDGNGTGQQASAEDQDGGFFETIRELLARIARFGTDFACGDRPDPDLLAEAVTGVQQAAQPHGFVRVAEAAGQIAEATTANGFRYAELRLYEELAAAEAVMPEAARASGISPRDLVQVLVRGACL